MTFPATINAWATQNLLVLKICGQVGSPDQTNRKMIKQPTQTNGLAIKSAVFA